MEEVQEGVCESHTDGQSLALKIIRAGFYWPTLREDCLGYVKKCDRCQRHSNNIGVSAKHLYSIISSCPFQKWEIDILGHFPMSVRQFKFIVVVIEYFTKWVEAEPLTTITTEKISKFI